MAAGLPIIQSASAALERVSMLAHRSGVTLLRCALGIVFVWFGGLKVAGHSEVFGLIGATLPRAGPHVFVPLLGCVEVLLRLGPAAVPGERQPG